MNYLVFSATPESWAKKPREYDKFLGTYSDTLFSSLGEEIEKVERKNIKLNKNLLGGATPPAVTFSTIAFVRKDTKEFTDEEFSA